MHVGRDRIGKRSLRDRRLGHRVIEASAAVADVEMDTTLFRFQRRRQQLAILNDVGELAGDVGRPGVAMREDVAGSQQVKDLRHELRRLDAADMAHDLRAGARHLAGLDRAFERLDAMLGDHVLRHAHLDAQRDVGVLRDGPRRRLDLREVDVVQLADREPGEAHVGDVHERVEPRAGRRDDKAPIGREVVRARVAGGHGRRGSLERHELVGGNADGGAVRKRVRVQIDEAGRHQPPGGVDDSERPLGGNIGLHDLDQAVANADVTHTAQALAGVEDVATLDQQVELVVGAHRRVDCR